LAAGAVGGLLFIVVGVLLFFGLIGIKHLPPAVSDRFTTESRGAHKGKTPYRVLREKLS
jgi:hypothetical protein